MTRLMRERVVQIVGRSRLDDHMTAEILRSGATESELIEAMNRVYRGGEIDAERGRPASRTVAHLCEILSTGQPWDEPD